MDKQQLEVIDQLYKSILKPDDWQSLIQRICEDIGAFGFNVVVVDNVFSEIQNSYASSSLIESFLVYVEQGFYDQEVALLDTLDITTKGDRVVSLTNIVQEHNKLSNNFVDLSPSWEWNKKNFDITERFFYSLGDNRAQVDCLHMCLQENQNIERAVERCNFYLPHLSNLVNTSRPFMLLQARFKAVLEVLDRFNLAIFLLTRKGEIIDFNEAAYAVIESGDAFCVNDKKILQVNELAANNTFQYHVNNLSKSGSDRTCERFLIRRRSKKLDYLCELSAILHGELPIGTMLIISDPEQKQLISTNNFDALFGLTGAELAVCQMLVQGFTNRDIAEQRNTSIDTIRNQIKSVLNKTSSNRQVDLVRLAFSTNLPVDEIDDK
jgi:DNA-binding CsgD family transcriptional regulator